MTKFTFRLIITISAVVVGLPVVLYHYGTVNVIGMQGRTKLRHQFQKQNKWNLTNDVIKNKTEETFNSPKTILWYFPPRYIPKNITSKVPLPACPESNCFVTRNRTFLPESDAVIFNSQYIEGALPPRKPGQVWIFHNSDVPYVRAYSTPYYRKPWSSSFNWTMTFRHDSDIFRPYGVLRRRQNIPVKNYTSIVEKKTGLVAWMVSNCEDWSKRRSYVKELQKHIQVDIYGFCGKRVFKRDRNKDWMAHLNETYKFYLAFENNFCLDYISEKFFSYFNLDLVTVVRGGGDYSRDAPPKTYLNVDNFKSPKELADYLWFLNNNTDRYIDILKRKEQYYYQNEEYLFFLAGSWYLESYYEQEPLCELCRRLRDITHHRKTIPDILPWWKRGLCRNPATYM